MPWPKSTKAERIRKGNLMAANCPTRTVLDNVTSRWGSLVLVLLLEDTYRFSELAYRIGGVSEKMLAQSLRALEADGFVLRTVQATKPPRVQYSLTAFGREIAVRMRELTRFIEANVGVVLKNRSKGVQPLVRTSSSQR